MTAFAYYDGRRWCALHGHYGVLESCRQCREQFRADFALALARVRDTRSEVEAEIAERAAMWGIS